MIRRTGPSLHLCVRRRRPTTGGRHGGSRAAGPHDPRGRQSPSGCRCGCWPRDAGRQRCARRSGRRDRPSHRPGRAAGLRQGLRRGDLRPRARARPTSRPWSPRATAVHPGRRPCASPRTSARCASGSPPRCAGPALAPRCGRGRRRRAGRRGRLAARRQGGARWLRRARRVGGRRRRRGRSTGRGRGRGHRRGAVPLGGAGGARCPVAVGAGRHLPGGRDGPARRHLRRGPGAGARLPDAVAAEAQGLAVRPGRAAGRRRHAGRRAVRRPAAA